MLRIALVTKGHYASILLYDVYCTQAPTSFRPTTTLAAYETYEIAYFLKLYQ
jgi:hypothetical protein